MPDFREDTHQRQTGLAGERAREAARSQPDQERFAADVRAHELAVQQMRERRLGPGETPKRAEDVLHPDGTRRPGELVGSPSLEDAEAHGNPIIPIDASGHKVHPSDAFAQAVLADVGQSQGFGGSGRGVPADVRFATGAGPGPGSTDYRVTERIDPQTGELVRQKIGAGGEVLDEQREPAPQREPSRYEQDRAADRNRRDDSNGPVL